MTCCILLLMIVLDPLLFYVFPRHTEFFLTSIPEGAMAYRYVSSDRVSVFPIFFVFVWV